MGREKTGSRASKRETHGVIFEAGAFTEGVIGQSWSVVDYPGDRASERRGCRRPARSHVSSNESSFDLSLLRSSQTHIGLHCITHRLQSRLSSDCCKKSFRRV